MSETLQTRHAPIRSSDMYGSYDEPWVVVCPVCNFEYVHHSREPLTFKDGRGTAIVLFFWCENGHRFSIKLAFHKGNIFVSVPEASDIDYENERPHELWRD